LPPQKDLDHSANQAASSWPAGLSNSLVVPLELEGFCPKGASQPIVFGVPFPKGALCQTDELSLFGIVDLGPYTGANTSLLVERQHAMASGRISQQSTGRKIGSVQAAPGNTCPTGRSTFTPHRRISRSGYPSIGCFPQRGTELADRASEDLLQFEARPTARDIAIVRVEGTRDSYFGTDRDNAASTAACGNAKSPRAGKRIMSLSQTLRSSPKQGK
jgi:hypothetical protein